MISPELVFDLSLVLLLVGLATAAIHASQLYTAVVSFIVFGLMLALTWARLGAMDLALAEAAIGAGLIGVLLLGALGRSAAESANPIRPAQRIAGLVLGLLVLVLLGQAVMPLPGGQSSLPGEVMRALDDSGASHPVTAVLLNFRAWDTLLELIVLLLALLGVRQLRPHTPALPAAWPLLRAWSRVLAPLTVMVGGYLLWRGSHAPGGAFQAGAILAAGAVILRLGGILPHIGWQHWWLRALVLLGVALFSLVAAASAWLGDGWLVYPQQWSGGLILMIEIAATLSIAAALMLLVIGDTEELAA
ncbi:hydrogenase subunit MbhD domain-containing protein [Halopseudomonas pelagia]|uniref:hydrogenase subunit MbhD domain-containing protein n=1 Tax=Halopseudomonas pelagia TaxID=553151 RepID=UPI00039B0751|nr:hydrogenase subunit MbhD domain-containing protein [Halopseudomonas pelagia]|tara:strand:- start:1391 stop:2302 length:912 start_codon:yes stop_codon:yes gene_type:complete